MLEALPLPQPTSEELSRFWNKPRCLAAQLLAEGNLTGKQVADKVGKSEKWLYEQKKHSWFKTRVDELVADLAEEARRIGIGNQTTRLLEQNGRWELMQQVIEERAAYPKWQHIPGWKTGLLVHDIKTTKDDAYDIFKVDDGLLGEMRALEAQVAKELGQTAEKKSDGDTNIYGGQVLIVRDVPRLGV